MGGFRRPAWLIAAAVVLAAVAVVVVVLVAGGGEEAKAQTVRFQDPTERGPDPFTRPTDVSGHDVVHVGSGPFGGTGSDRVCDRELLIRSLKARPDRLRAWAEVAGVEPTPAAVARYIRRLRPVTLTQDTRVTNHSFVDGRAVAFQSILQAGTAVLVDEDGKPVARCRCGNPLSEPVFIKSATCYGCPPHYRPPPPCHYYNYDDSDYGRYGDDYFRATYDPRDYRGKCYRPYPDPPRVRRRTPPYPAEPAQQEPLPEPAPVAPQTTPAEPQLNCEAPRSQLEFEQCRDRGQLPQQQQPQTTPQPQEEECTVPLYRTNGCANLRDKSTDPGIQP